MDQRGSFLQAVEFFRKSVSALVKAETINLRPYEPLSESSGTAQLEIGACVEVEFLIVFAVPFAD